MYESISIEDIKSGFAEGKKIIDVREPFETVHGMIPGAVNIPLQQLPMALDELSKNDEYILICKAGVRSEHACYFLSQHGYKTYNVVEGMLGWYE